jgi:uncharacterized protein YceH (UPF0502 family)
LRGRAERMYRFEELEDVVGTLERLSQREPALVAMLPRQPGTKESRYMHLLSGAGESIALIPRTGDAEFHPAESDRLGRLEDEVAALRKELTEVQRQLGEFRKQFE